MKSAYAKQISKDYLKYLGINEVSDDGLHIYRNGKEIKQYVNNSGYLVVVLYDPALRQLISPEVRNSGSGEFLMPVHRLVYAWYNLIVPHNFVVDHINDDKTDNRIENLQLLTPGENLNKNKKYHQNLKKCKLNRPREYYEEKLEKFSLEYELAKENHDSEKAHALRSYISQYRARLRYWDLHNIN